MPLPKVLFVGDDRELRAIGRDIGARGFQVAGAQSSGAALKQLGAVDALLIDDDQDDALSLLRGLKRSHPRIVAVVLTGNKSVSGAVRAMKLGADECLARPVDAVTLAATFERLLAARAPACTADAPDPFIGPSAAIAQLADVARRVAGSDQPILILGETGVGKGVLANWLHRHGARAGGPFVDLNCGGFSREFLESELFGHEKGAFTGAVASKPGMLEIADGGVVFLDEVGDLDAQVQPKVVKVLEEKRFHRIGEVRDRHVDVHLIAATNQDLVTLVKQRAFRGDLYFRISALPLVVPPLRERKEDIPALARRLLDGLPISDDAVEILVQHRWPGNIRELKNLLRRARLLAGGEPITAEYIRFDAGAEHGAGSRPWCSDTSLTLRALEKQYIHTVLREEHGRVEQAARRLGVPRSSLYHKLKEYGLRPGV